VAEGRRVTRDGPRRAASHLGGHAGPVEGGAALDVPRAKVVERGHELRAPVQVHVAAREAVQELTAERGRRAHLDEHVGVGGAPRDDLAQVRRHVRSDGRERAAAGILRGGRGLAQVHPLVEVTGVAETPVVGHPQVVAERGVPLVDAARRRGGDESGDERSEARGRCVHGASVAAAAGARQRPRARADSVLTAWRRSRWCCRSLRCRSRHG
jgi:hypothetical protein